MNPENTPGANSSGRLPLRWYRNLSNGWRSVLSTILILATASVIALSISSFVVQSYQVDGQSMETTLQDHDRLIVNKIPRTWARFTSHDYIPKRGQVIIFNQSGIGGESSGQKQLIKRVVGLPGEHVVVKAGSIVIYNSDNPNGFNPDKLGSYRIAATDTPGNVDLTLTKDEIFVCGDNRTNSEDSRYFGPVLSRNIVGKLVIRILPLNNVQRF